MMFGKMFGMVPARVPASSAGRNLISICFRLSVNEFRFLKGNNVRLLYSAQYLGLDKHLEVCQKVGTQFAGLKDKFCTRMKNYVNEEGQSMIFTEDLKNMLHLVEDKPEDIEVCIRMILKFHHQNKELRFGTFVFGPVVMRWIWHINKPDLAWQLLTNQELAGFFDQKTSYLLGMDLLYKHQQYKDILQLFDQLVERNLQGMKYPRDPFVLALGSCYKLNTPESFQKCISLIQAAREDGDSIIRRGVAFAAALALNQNDPKTAMELLSLTPFSNYVTVRNLRLTALADLNRVDDIFPILRSVIDRDVPRDKNYHKDICQETLEHIQKKVEEANDKEMSHIFEQICRALKENNRITSETMDGLLSEPIVARIPYKGDKDTTYQAGSTSRPGRSYNTYRGESHRGVQSQHFKQGLRDMDE